MTILRVWACSAVVLLAIGTVVPVENSFFTIYR